MTDQGKPTTAPHTFGCRMCQGSFTFVLDPAKVWAWQQGALLQDVLPELSLDDRELLISGICKSCWVRVFQRRNVDEGEA